MTEDAEPGGPSYPPSPWLLRAQLHLSVWPVPAARLPVVDAPGVRPLVVGGRGVIGTAWADYRPGGALQYHELLSAVAVRRGSRPRASITGIWVDSPVSRDGGRELWGIPKDLAGFTMRHEPGFGAEARTTEGALIASVRVRPGAVLPRRWAPACTLAQSLAGRGVDVPVSARARLVRTAAEWEINPQGPLGFLHGLRPLLSVWLKNADVRVGRQD